MRECRLWSTIPCWVLNSSSSIRTAWPSHPIQRHMAPLPFSEVAAHSRRGGAASRHLIRMMRALRRPCAIALSASRNRARENKLRRYGMRGVGRALFAATLLLMAGFINIIYGIGALDDANIFVHDQRYIFTNLNTMGWVLIVLGIIQIAGGLALYVGNTFGR